MNKVYQIKRAQKAAQLLRSICTLFSGASRDDDRLQGSQITRVELSDDRSRCYVFFYNAGGEEAFRETLRYLILYKPSLRAALAKEISGRYTPELEFVFDHSFEKIERLESLFEKIKEKDELD
jgi:ribosome-binding factor A